MASLIPYVPGPEQPWNKERVIHFTDGWALDQDLSNWHLLCC